MMVTSVYGQLFFLVMNLPIQITECVMLNNTVRNIYVFLNNVFVCINSEKMCYI